MKNLHNIQEESVRNEYNVPCSFVFCQVSLTESSQPHCNERRAGASCWALDAVEWWEIDALLPYRPYLGCTVAWRSTHTEWDRSILEHSKQTNLLLWPIAQITALSEPQRGRFYCDQTCTYIFDNHMKTVPTDPENHNVQSLHYTPTA